MIKDKDVNTTTTSGRIYTNSWFFGSKIHNNDDSTYIPTPKTADHRKSGRARARLMCLLPSHRSKREASPSQV